MSLTTFFTDDDFNIFLIDGLENRMTEIQRQIQPKFKKIGNQITPFLTTLLEEPVTMHIAKHARRTVNPPDETWMAWSTNRRGYKAHPHFQVGLNKNYLFICFALIYECTKKAIFAHNMKKSLDKAWPLIPDNYYISFDHTKPYFKHPYEMTKEDISVMLNRLSKVKQAEFLCGLHIPKNNTQSHLEEGALLKQIQTTIETIYPLYLLAKEGDQVDNHN